MTAVLPSTTDTLVLSDFLDLTAIEIGLSAYSDGDPETVLLAADRVERALAGLQARWLDRAEKSGVVRRSGARNPAAWLEALTGESLRDAHAKAGVADATSRTPSVGAGLLDGSLNAAQAEQIQRTADATQAPAERIEEFVEEVKGLSARETARAARDLERELSTETPEERFEQQRRKRSATTKTSSDGSGMFELHAQFDPLTGERIRVLLIKAVKQLHQGDDEKRSYRQLSADALEQLITGSSGGSGNTRAGDAGRSCNVDVVVTVTLDDLIRGVNATGNIAGKAETIPVREIRRLASELGVYPAVLGSAGEVLDLGRRARLASTAQKRALKVTYGGCGVAGCNVPFDFCQIHHIWEWLNGGPTDLDYLIPLCSHHHHLVHDQGWTLTRDADGTMTLMPP